MSLTGLDTPAVEEALKKVLNERGGWFLLSYETRDTVGILAEGVRGLHEMRDAAISYYSSALDIKPLFGLTQFRRRKVLVRLVPEDTSRLFKARVQVHWFAVNARFPAFDTAYEITKSEELDDNAVGHHLDLHSSRSSTGSAKKPALHGIDEAAEDPADFTTADEPQQTTEATLVEDRPAKRSEDTTALIERSRNLAATMNNPGLPMVEVVIPPPEQEEIEVSNVDMPRPPKEYAASVNHYVMDNDASSLYDPPPRLSSQTMRPTTASSTNDPFAHLFPKVKLGPRPSLDRRPMSSRSESQRSVAALPSSIRNQRTLTTSQRPKSRDSATSTFTAQPAPPMPTTPVNLQRRPTSSGASIRSLPATLPKTDTMTPEKARLLKFRDMYRQKEANRVEGAAIPPVPPLPQNIQSVSEQNVESQEKLEEPQLSKSGALGDHMKSDSGVGMDKAVDAAPGVLEIENGTPSSLEPETTGLQDETCKVPDQTAPHAVEETEEILPVADSDADHSARVISTPIAASDLLEEASKDAEVTSPTKSEAAPDRITVSSTESAFEQMNEEITPVPSEKVPSMVVLAEETVSQERLPDEPSSTPNTEDAVLESIEDGKTTPQQQVNLNDDSDDDDDWVNLRSNRRALVNPISGDDPIATETNSLVSEEEYDDDFMDELQSAIVEEAKTMPMPRSPGAAFFPKHNSGVYSDQNLARKSTASLVHVNGTSPAKSSPPPMPSPLELPGPFPMISRSPTGERISALPTPPRDEGLTVMKKSKMGSGVAAKIADLQRNFSRGSMNGVSTSSNYNKGIEVVRKASTVSQRTAALGDSVARATTPPWQVQMQRQRSGVSLASSIDPDQADKERPYFTPVVNARINKFETTPAERLTKPDNLSVTATIVRANESPDALYRNTSSEFHESPISISQEASRADKGAKPRPATAHATRPAPSVQVAMPTSRTPSADSVFTSKLGQVESYQPRPPSNTGSPRKSTDSAWRSFARKMTKSDSNKSPNLPPPSQAVQPLSPPQTATSTPQIGSAMPSPEIGRSLSNDSMSTLASTESVRGASASEKKASRASRMMRRMSNSMSSIASITRIPLGSLSPPQSLRGNGSRDIIPTVHEDASEPNHQPRPHPLDLGDLNVQFPDTLLWKRRFVSIDPYGFLVLKPVDGSVGRSFKNAGGFNSARREAADLANTRRYHLTEFLEPFAPDLERMEMPNSVVLDFKDGKVLQCQCEGTVGQARLLRCLLDSYRGWQ